MSKIDKNPNDDFAVFTKNILEDDKNTLKVNYRNSCYSFLLWVSVVSFFVLIFFLFTHIKSTDLSNKKQFKEQSFKCTSQGGRYVKTIESKDRYGYVKRGMCLKKGSVIDIKVNKSSY